MQAEKRTCKIHLENPFENLMQKNCFHGEGDFLNSSRSCITYLSFSISSVTGSHFEGATKSAVCKMTAYLYSEM